MPGDRDTVDTENKQCSLVGRFRLSQEWRRFLDKQMRRFANAVKSERRDHILRSEPLRKIGKIAIAGVGEGLLGVKC